MTLQQHSAPRMDKVSGKEVLKDASLNSALVGRGCSQTPTSKSFLSGKNIYILCLLVELNKKDCFF